MREGAVHRVALLIAVIATTMFSTAALTTAMAVAPNAGGGFTYAQSTHWSGYTVSTSHVTGAEAKWRVPRGRITGPEGAEYVIWVGIGGWGTEAENRNIAQVGTLAYILPKGVVRQRVWYEWDTPSSNHYIVTNVPISPGDEISAKVVRLGTARWRVRLVDTTSGRHFTNTHHFHSLESSADVIVEDPYNNPSASPYSSEAFPFPHFSPVRFTDAKLRIGRRWNSFDMPPSEQISLAQHGRTLAESSPLVRGAFTVTRTG